MLDGLVDGVGERGGALVVRGEAGIGKSALLAAHVPALAPRARERLLGEAAGNPLALMELPVHWDRTSSAGLRCRSGCR